MKNFLISIAAISAAVLISSCKESFPSKVISVETVDGCTLVTSEVYPVPGDTIKVWIGLPEGEWDGRLVGTGGAGFYGGKSSNAIKWAKKGMVGVASNCGHDNEDWTWL
ncbi:MAG: hypothetical protein HUJ95_03315, partial [Bacteroidales bacterium]|nr:hypothetical protein [Bacteroidales bacterium]